MLAAACTSRHIPFESDPVRAAFIIAVVSLAIKNAIALVSVRLYRHLQ